MQEKKKTPRGFHCWQAAIVTFNAKWATFKQSFKISWFSGTGLGQREGWMKHKEKSGGNHLDRFEFDFIVDVYVIQK